MSKIYLWIVISSVNAWAFNPLLDRENCTYSGKKLNKAVSKETATEIPEVDPNFSGLVVCADHQTGRIQEHSTIHRGELEGESRKFDSSSGKLQEVANYKAGQLDGTFTRYHHVTGRVVQIINYNNGSPSGVQRDFDSDTGTPKRVFWTDPKGRGTEMLFNKKGQLTELTCGEQSDGLTIDPRENTWCGRDGKTSQVLIHNEDGSLRQKRAYLKNKKDGEWIKYHKDGWVMSRETYVADKVQKREAFSKEGAPRLSQSYSTTQKGKDGKEIAYFPDGGTQLIREVKNGHVVTSEEFYQNKKLKQRIKFESNKISLSEFYDSGNPKRVAHFLPIQHQGSSANNAVIRNNIITNWQYGMIIDGYSGVSSNNLVYNNLVYRNTGDGIKVRYMATTVYLYNNTVYENGGYGVFFDSSTSGSVARNNIVYANNYGPVLDEAKDTIFSENFTSDPIFVDPSNGDFHLTSNSGAVGAAKNLSSLFTEDKDGKYRPARGAWDSGAYVAWASPSPSPSPNPTPVDTAIPSVKIISPVNGSTVVIENP